MNCLCVKGVVLRLNLVKSLSEIPALAVYLCGKICSYADFRVVHTRR